MVSSKEQKGVRLYEGAPVRRRLAWVIVAVGVIGLAVLGVLEMRSQSQAVQERLDAVETAIEEQAPPNPAPSVPSPRWMVTETQMQRNADGVTFTISYEGVEGTNKTWRRDVGYGESGSDVTDMFTCWQSARLGLPLPLCARQGY